MQEAAELGMVVLAHCENGRVIDVLTRQLIERGELGTGSLPRSRPIALEAETVHRFLVLAELAGATPYVVHVTGREPLDEIVRARARGLHRVRRGLPPPPAVRRLGPCRPRRGALRHDAPAPHRRRPPCRSPRRCATAGSTRSPPTTATCASTTSSRSSATSAGSPTGLPGIAARLPIGFTLAPGGAPLPVERLVEVASAAPARIFGLPRKGSVAPGYDADLVVFDPSRPSEITVESVDDGLGWTPYAGTAVPGSFRYVLARGDVMVEDGRFSGAEHEGAHLPIARVAARA